MQAFGLIEKLEELATARGWKFLNGSREYANIDADFSCGVGQLILWVNVVPSIVRAGGNRLTQINYVSDIGLFRKFDADSTPASLDENFHQKYTRRLVELSNQLANELQQLACDNQLQINSETYEYLINTFDTNMDGVMSRTNLEQSIFEL